MQFSYLVDLKGEEEFLPFDQCLLSRLNKQHSRHPRISTIFLVDCKRTKSAIQLVG